jgi:hypothetical protein
MICALNGHWEDQRRLVLEQDRGGRRGRRNLAADGTTGLLGPALAGDRGRLARGTAAGAATFRSVVAHN